MYEIILRLSFVLGIPIKAVHKILAFADTSNQSYTTRILLAILMPIFIAHDSFYSVFTM